MSSGRKQAKRPYWSRNETKWKKGESGNPNGRPPLSRLKEHDKILTRDELRKVITKVWHAPQRNLVAFIEDENTSSGEAAVASMLLRAIESGLPNGLEALLERLHGRVGAIHEDDQGDPVTFSDLMKQAQAFRAERLRQERIANDAKPSDPIDALPARVVTGSMPE